ncbi:MAG TPA: GTP cyclohydrolase I [Polyangiaceae bacterium]|nr:GTP cyclohydrolase I [Polyangiaceae bacterium]
MKRIDRARAERAVREFLVALGRDPDRDADLADTPARVVEAYADELLGGYGVDVAALLAQGEVVGEGKLSGLIALKGISVSTVCPHHLLLSHGSASVVYRPGTRLFGLGTLAAVVGAYARRLSLQESIGENAVQALVQHGGARAAYCEVRLVHGCLVARGAREAATELVTTARRGDLDPAELAWALGRQVEAKS